MEVGFGKPLPEWERPLFPSEFSLQHPQFTFTAGPAELWSRVTGVFLHPLTHIDLRPLHADTGGGKEPMVT